MCLDEPIVYQNQEVSFSFLQAKQSLDEVSDCFYSRCILRYSHSKIVHSWSHIKTVHSQSQTKTVHSQSHAEIVFIASLTVRL